MLALQIPPRLHMWIISLFSIPQHGTLCVNTCFQEMSVSSVQHAKNTVRLYRRWQIATNTKNQERVSATSHTKYRYLQDHEENERLHNMHAQYKTTKSKENSLREKIAMATEKSGVVLDEEIHEDMC